MHFTVSKACYFVAVAILFLIGFDIWNPHSDVDWGTVAVGLLGLGLFFEGVGPSHTIFEHTHS